MPESTHPFERNPDLEMIEIGPKYMNIRTKFPQNSPTCVNNSVSKCLTSDNNHELVMSRAKWVGNGRREEIRLTKNFCFVPGPNPLLFLISGSVFKAVSHLRSRVLCFEMSEVL